MYIEVGEDILQNAIDKKGFDRNMSRDVLIFMALCAMNGKHYVVVPSLSKKQNLRDEIEQLIGRDYVTMLNYSMDVRNRQRTSMLKEKVCIRALLTINRETTVQNGVIVINLLEQKRFEPWSETFILTENLMDSDFYNYLIRYYKSKEGITNCNECYHALMGGGVTISKVMRREIHAAQHFCLAIADSDKKSPDGEIGETSKELLDQITSIPFNCGVYVMNKVMEIENLIPMKLVIVYGDKAGYKEIFASDKDPSFFDMKKGLSLKCLYNDKVYKYWKNLITDETARFKERDEKIKNCATPKSYNDKVRDLKPIKKGFGDKLLANLLEGENIQSPQKSAVLMCQITDRDLTCFQQEEWYAIGKQMFGWTCAVKAR